MSTVLQFTPSERHITHGDDRGGRHACEIVIFPGIRIERHDNEPHDTSDSSSGGPPRSRERRRPRRTS